MKIQNDNIRRNWLMRLAVLTLLQLSTLNAQLSTLLAQEVSVSVTPIQQVLPPQAGQYVENPGKFFTVSLTNNTDEQQLLHLGMHIDQTYPDEKVMMVTRYGHIPRQPIMLSPRQTKILNPVEMKQLFQHFTFDDVYISDGLYSNYEKGIFGLLPEGQYQLYMQAYRWDPELTSAVQLNSPDNGLCTFNVCYTAQAPTFLTPLVTADSDPLSQLSVAKLDINAPSFSWTQPTLNCNASIVNFTYDVKIVKLDGLMPDEAIERNADYYVRRQLSTPSLTIPTAYITRMKAEDENTVYAIQVTAHTTLTNSQNSLNYTLIENDGKSDVMLFRLFDPTKQLNNDNENANEDENKDKDKDGDVVKGKASDVDATKDSKDSLYVFEQPTLTAPSFPKRTARKVYLGDSIAVEWRKAWFSSGRGERQDTVKFEYTMSLYKGNSADEPKAIFLTKPVYTHKTTELKDTIKWKDIKDKVMQDDYLLLRVTAKATNVKSIRMHGDSLNYVDFVMTDHFQVDYACGSNTSKVENQTPIEEVPKPGTQVRIGSWWMELGKDVKQDKETKALSGTGFVIWTPGPMKIRVAVKFDKLMVNTDKMVFDGICNTYPNPNGKKLTDEEFTAQQAVDSLFSDWGLDNVWGDLGLPKGVAEKVTDELGSVADNYDLGKYYSYFKQAEKQWDKWQQGEWLDLYFPTELPDTIANLLPDDFSMQIASIIFTPKAAAMNVIGEFVLPKSDVLKNDVLIFGAPKLCIEPDRFIPEDGTLALLSNFTIQDPSSDWSMTFKAPSEPLRPQDGCFLQWEDDRFSGLGVEIAMTIPNLKRVVDGKKVDEPPLLDLRATIENSWGDWMGKITMDPFEVEDLPGWIFSPGKEIVFDHSYEKNDPVLPDVSRLPRTYDPSQVNSYCKTDWKAWQGVYVDELSVQFPKWAVFGNEKEGLKIAGQKMLFDNSGVTCDIAALNILNAKTGKAGGWEFDLDMAKVMITQNNFDSCHIEGRFGIPIFGKKDSIDVNKGKVRFNCDIRHLTDGETTYYTYDKEGKREAHKKKTYGENARMAYLFRTQQIDSLDFSCFVADVNLEKDQTYFVLSAEDLENGSTKTYVELNMAGQINIADSNSTVNSIREYARKLPLNMDFRGIHFAKMRLANFSYTDTARVYKEMGAIANDSTSIKRVRAEQAWEKEHSGRWIAFKNKEMKLSDACFLDLGEWSLTSPKKKIGPFSVELKEFKPNYNSSEKKVTLGIEGVIGFCDDKVTAGVGIDISTNLTIPSDYTNISGYSLSWGGIDFRSVEVKADMGMLTMNGRLEVKDDDKNGKGYAGNLELEVKELFKLNVTGGYFNHKPDENEKKDNNELKNAKADGDEDPNKEYAWGYFTASLKMDAKTSPLRFDPLVITRISGGFYYNCLPVYDKTKKTFGDPECHYGMIGISFGMGLASTAGEKTLSGDMDLNVIYDKANHRLTTFAFKGNVKAVSGMIDANMMLLYQNDDKDRFLSLDITVEAGFSNGALGDKIAAMSTKLKEEDAKLREFQRNLDDKVRNFESDPTGSLAALNSDYENTTTDKDKKTNEEKKTKKGDADKDAEIKVHEMSKSEKEKVKAGEVKISLNLLVTWKKDGVTYNTPKWHLYLGEPEKDKRCKIVLVDFKSYVVSVDIGADAYLCVGNELPNNGQLPPIDPEITKFLNGGSETVNTNADLNKAEQSRAAAVRSMLGTVNGGVMVGASAWGYINIDLGLFYGYLKAIAGFDISVADYGNSAFCVNLNKRMGRDGWYAMGQFYAYLAAKFGLHIKLGKLIDKRIDIVDAGIGGVFECGLPSPTWIEGRARVKISLLDGLIKINKKFDFECGDRCVAFVGNALDDFNLFDTFTLGTDSVDTGWDEANAYTVDEAMGRAMFTTTASLNSQYRLVDPTALNDIKDGIQADSLLAIHAARTYIFNLDEEKNEHDGQVYGTKGVRLWELDEYDRKAAGYRFGPSYTVERLKTYMPSFESSISYSKRDLDCPYVTSNEKDRYYNFIVDELNDREIPVGVRDKKGTKYHLSGMNLKPGKCYMLVLTGTAYEVENGQRYWCEITDTTRMVNVYQKWMQRKFYFFRTKEREAVSACLDDLTPYIALAYPAPAVGEVTNDEWANAEAYIEDLCQPTIALKEDLSDTEFAKSGKLQWTLRSKLRNSKNFVKTETRDNRFVKNGNCVNMEPDRPFNIHMASDTDDNPLMHNLRLTYIQPSYRALVNWMKEHKYNARSYFGWFSDYYLELYNADPNSVPSDSVHSALYIADWLKNHQAAPVDVDTLDIPLREVVLYDAWFRRSDRTSWKEYLPTNNEKKLNGYRGYTDPLPYERPFIGVRPASPGPNYSYPAIQPYTQDPYTVGEKGYLQEKMDGQRLLDPYAYFSYLSNWVFIGGRAINSYNFDDIRTPHASESLTFSYNTTDLTGVSQISGLRTADAMKVLRNSMANVWNTWYYNDPAQPQYPLPTRLGPEYDRTFANQDGKAQAYYTPWNKEEQQKQKCYGARELWLDFAAPYYVAEALSNKLAEIADELTGKWSKTCQGDKFDQAIKDWNNTHRGQYLTVECRGFQVKVPYYQFPLIFGDCCVGGYDPVTDTHPDETKRGFGKSLGGKSNIIAARWKSYVSCLFWFRLRGGYPWRTSDDFDQFYESRYLNGKARKYIEREYFRARDAMQYIGDLQAYIYRVNAYDINTGLYTYQDVGACSDDSDMAPWFNRSNVTKDKDVVWTNWLDMNIGHPEVRVNGKICQYSYKGYSDYQNLDTTPDEKPVDNSGTQEPQFAYTGNSSHLHSLNQGTQNMSQGTQATQGGNDMFSAMADAMAGMMGGASTNQSGTQSADELIYQQLKAAAESNVNTAIEMLRTIKAQDEDLFKRLFRQLVADMPQLKTRLTQAFSTTTAGQPYTGGSSQQGTSTRPGKKYKK